MISILCNRSQNPTHPTCLKLLLGQHLLEQWFSTSGLRPLWGSNDTFTGVDYQMSCMLCIYTKIHSSSKTGVMK